MERILNPPITRENSPLSQSLIVTARAVILYCSIVMAILIFALIGAYTLSVMLADASNLSQHRQQNNHVPYVYAAYTRATPAAGGPTLKDPNLKVEKIFQGDLGITTSMAFLGPNDILVLEKNGKVHRIKDGVAEPVLAVSNVGKEIEWGMLGIAVDKVNSDNTVARTTSNPNQYRHCYIANSDDCNQRRIVLFHNK
jgi:hypothetical protein